MPEEQLIYVSLNYKVMKWLYFLWEQNIIEMICGPPELKLFTFMSQHKRLVTIKRLI